MRPKIGDNSKICQMCDGTGRVWKPGTLGAPCPGCDGKGVDSARWPLNYQELRKSWWMEPTN